jgi:hypothetical protein
MKRVSQRKIDDGVVAHLDSLYSGTLEAGSKSLHSVIPRRETWRSISAFCLTDDHEAQAKSGATHFHQCTCYGLPLCVCYDSRKRAVVGP